MATSDSPGLKIGGYVQTVRNYGGRVIANFVPKFVAMAMGVGTGKI